MERGSLGLQQAVVFAAAEEEATCAEVLEVGHAGVGEWLAVGRFLARALHPSEEAVGMDALLLQCRPGAVAGGSVLLGGQQSLADAPAHAVEEEGGARELGAGIVVADEADVPQSVLALAFEQGLAHTHEVLAQQRTLSLEL